ncbi:4-(cytidine 5'-diphospho)-2-C-methyl-D-erythritol kinase [Candidatus Erwinia haradaeae]|uniref:4-diphosphocytidyl-2-C-methyl-D-erythritol kinase n=1 Tax=Candidatus Erwinia haradaeae TaxID=1922217 RepID=A0A451DMN8_9GAMM|nr:4-(cytidine 5'-diphospho)-2-C-methyl-D-erythritol kinase [Candidatus Erwinia haradaeae]VFP88045.1 4-diphosphocytidyl-2-C-methyl-D-erythritol kinase [Candidatus Erwinia haradaeae]
MITKWPSPGKLNLFLHIIGRRSDGYHNLQTLFQLLDYGDTLSIKSNQSGEIILLKSLPGVVYEKNLIVRAAKLLRDQAKLYGKLPDLAGATLKIKKRLPIGGGLGGGSSNAATVLVALNYLWNINFSVERLAALGLQLGADVPVFIYGLSSFSAGIGELLTPIVLSNKWYLVIYPNVGINTFQIFNDPNLTRNTPYRQIRDLLLGESHNDCEIVARSHCNEIEQLISWVKPHARPHLTGTGSCVFAEFSTKLLAFQVLSLVPKRWAGFIARGINLSPLYNITVPRFEKKVK